MRIFVKQLQGEPCVFDLVSDGDTVQDLKRACQATFGVAVQDQRLVVGGKVLKDEAKLNGYGLCEGTVVYLVPKPTIRSSDGDEGSLHPEPQAGDGHRWVALQPGRAETPDGRNDAGKDGSHANATGTPMTPGPQVMYGVIEAVQQLSRVTSHPEVVSMVAKGFELLRDPQALERVLNSEDFTGFVGSENAIRQSMEQIPHAGEIYGVLESCPTLKHVFQDPEAIASVMRRISRGINRAPPSATFAEADVHNAAPARNPNADPLPNPWSRGQPPTNVDEVLVELGALIMEAIPTGASAPDQSIPQEAIERVMGVLANATQPLLGSQDSARGGGAPNATTDAETVGTARTGATTTGATDDATMPPTAQGAQQNAPCSLEELTQLVQRLLLGQADGACGDEKEKEKEEKKETEETEETEEKDSPDISGLIRSPSGDRGDIVATNDDPQQTSPCASHRSRLSLEMDTQETSDTCGRRESAEAMDCAGDRTGATEHEEALRLMRRTGFTDDQANMAALRATGGNVIAAIGRLAMGQFDAWCRDSGGAANDGETREGGGGDADGL